MNLLEEVNELTVIRVLEICVVVVGFIVVDGSDIVNLIMQISDFAMNILLAIESNIKKHHIKLTDDILNEFRITFIFNSRLDRPDSVINNIRSAIKLLLINSLIDAFETTINNSITDHSECSRMRLGNVFVNKYKRLVLFVVVVLLRASHLKDEVGC